MRERERVDTSAVYNKSWRWRDVGVIEGRRAPLRPRRAKVLTFSRRLEQSSRFSMWSINACHVPHILQTPANPSQSNVAHKIETIPFGSVRKRKIPNWNLERFAFTQISLSNPKFKISERILTWRIILICSNRCETLTHPSWTLFYLPHLCWPFFLNVDRKTSNPVCIYVVLSNPCCCLIRS